jgi:kinesin family protein 18/19
MKKEKKVKFNIESNEATTFDQKSNELKFNKDNMVVAIRVRPLNAREIEFSNIETVKINDKDTITINDPTEHKWQDDYRNRREQQYAFDFVFDKSTTQEDVYHQTTNPLLLSVIDGFNATVLAYGATGAGKTYTMVGNGENPGVMVRALSDLFDLLEKQNDKTYLAKISYLEVYNETLRDLLCDSDEISEIELREDPSKGVMFIGIKEVLVSNASEVFKILIKGNKNRSEEPTVHNEFSSRSHAILQVHIEFKDRVTGLDNEITLGKFILVDLAGSERAPNTKTSMARLAESSSINKSLLALANCINSLVDSGNKHGKTFIPWRDSKLTRILKVIIDF